MKNQKAITRQLLEKKGRETWSGYIRSPSVRVLFALSLSVSFQKSEQILSFYLGCYRFFILLSIFDVNVVLTLFCRCPFPVVVFFLEVLFMVFLFHCRIPMFLLLAFSVVYKIVVVLMTMLFDITVVLCIYFITLLSFLPFHCRLLRLMSFIALVVVFQSFIFLQGCRIDNCRFPVFFCRLQAFPISFISLSLSEFVSFFSVLSFLIYCCSHCRFLLISLLD